MMKKVLAAVVSATFLVSFSPVVGSAETACPEVDAAKAMLKQQRRTWTEFVIAMQRITGVSHA